MKKKKYVDFDKAITTYKTFGHLNLHNALEAFNEIPAADVRSVVRGEWEKTEDFDEYGGGRYVEWTCSECFYKVKGDWAVRDSHIDEKPRENFCPNCGADMREEEDG